MALATFLCFLAVSFAQASFCPSSGDQDAVCASHAEELEINDHYKHVSATVPPVPEEHLAIAHQMVDSSAKGIKKAETGIWIFDELLRPEVVSHVLQKLPDGNSKEWTGCPRIEHNKKKRCFMLPIGEDPMLKEVIIRFKAAWGNHLNTSEITHLAINRVLPGKEKDELHADIFAGRKGMERPTAHNIIYLTDATSPDHGKTEANHLSIPMSKWNQTKQWPARPNDAAKCGINIIYLTQQPAEVPAAEAGQLQFPRAGVTVTPKPGRMVSFAMTDDNDHVVGPMSEHADKDRISIQVPVSVFGPESATAYGEFVGNGGPSPPPGPPVPGPQPCHWNPANSSQDPYGYKNCNGCIGSCYMTGAAEWCGEQCNSSSVYMPGHCYQKTLEEAKALCTRLPRCTGVVQVRLFGGAQVYDVVSGIPAASPSENYGSHYLGLWHKNSSLVPPSPAPSHQPETTSYALLTSHGQNCIAKLGPRCCAPGGPRTFPGEQCPDKALSKLYSQANCAQRNLSTAQAICSRQKSCTHVVSTFAQVYEPRGGILTDYYDDDHCQNDYNDNDIPRDLWKKTDCQQPSQDVVVV